MFRNPGTSPVTGIRKLIYWVMSENTSIAASYSTAYPLPGVMSAKFSHSTDSTPVSAEDQIDEIIYGAGSDTAEIQEKNIPLEDLARILGHSIVNGVMVRNKDDIAPEVAIAYQSKKSNGSTEYNKYYCGRFTEPDKEADSDGEKTSPKYKTLKGSFYPRKLDGNSSAQMEEDSSSFNAANVENWYTYVDGVAPAVLALESSNPANNAANVAAAVHPALTFNNAINDQAVSLIKADGSAVSATASVDETGKVVTLTPGANLTSAGVYYIIVAGVKDVFDQVLASQTIKFTVA